MYSVLLLQGGIPKAIHAGNFQPVVPLSAARQGDILVFRTGSGPRGLHTGIYTGGNSFIHSPRQGENVRVESLEVPYWRNKLIAVRRVVY